MLRRRLYCPLFSWTLLCLSLAITEATYSIVATDAYTRQVGGAGASCIPNGDIFDALYLSAPNRSVFHTQGLLLERNSTIVMTAIDMMQTDDDSIGDILAKMRELDTEPYLMSEDGSVTMPKVDLRQYGMANFHVNDSHGGYTGSSLQEVYDDIFQIKDTVQIDKGAGRSNNDEDSGRYSFHAQGNVVKDGTVDSLYDGFVEGGDGSNICDMALRLMAAMDKVLKDGGGDMRCINEHNGISATGAFLHIDEADGKELIHINIVGDGTFEPLEKLRQEFFAWKEGNPCSQRNETSIDVEKVPVTDVGDANDIEAVDAADSSAAKVSSSYSYLVTASILLSFSATIAIDMAF